MGRFSFIFFCLISLQAFSDSLKPCAAQLNELNSVRVAFAQVNTTVGNFDSNLVRLIEFTKKAATENAEILIFPEMAFSGYPARDYLERPEFLQFSREAVLQYLVAIRAIAHAPHTIMIGSVTANPEMKGRGLQNSLLIIKDADVTHTQAKQLLPNYDVFDDMRHFEPGRDQGPWTSPWGKLGCAVCEDAWAGEKINGREFYENDPADKMVNVKLAVNISASPFYLGKQNRRDEIIGRFAQKIKAPVFYVNQVGATDDIIFDGGSSVYSSQGKRLYTFSPFTEGLAVFDFNSMTGEEAVNQVREFSRHDDGETWRAMASTTRLLTEVESLHGALILSIRDYFRKTGFKKAVLGLSGGIDSAVVATLLSEALGPENVLGLLMPGPYSSEGSILDAQLLAKNLGIHTAIVPITDSTAQVLTQLDSHIKSLSEVFPIPKDEAMEDNIQARLRMIHQYSFANKFGMLNISTSNKSELSVGQTTIFGDMAGALAPIADLFKTQVYALARHLNSLQLRIPENTLNKAPSAELAPNQSDEAKFGRFAVLDPVLEYYLEDQLTEEQIVAKGFDAAYVHQTIAYVRRNEFKRRVATIIPKVTKKAYGTGRRYPIASSLQGSETQH